MFCNQCGTKIPDGSRFCPTCGAEVLLATSALQDQRSMSFGKVILPLLKKDVRFDASIKVCIAFQEGFAELGNELAKDFIETFHSKYRDMDAFIRDFPNDFSEIFREGIDMMCEMLSDRDIFGVTNDELMPYREKYCYHTFSELQAIGEQYAKIVGTQEGMREYRQARKNNRGRVIGGGFGLAGAAKGIATAGAINMASGALHSVGNAIGNIGSAISAANEKNNLLNSGINARLANTIKEDIFGVHLVALDLISDRTGKALCKFTAANKQQADKIQADLEQGVISYNSQRAAVIRLLTTYPFQADYYRTAVKMFPCEIDHMREFSAFFGFHIEDFYCDMMEQANLATEILLDYRDDLEDILINDLDFPEDEVVSLTTDLDDMLEYFADIFEWADEKGFFIIPEADNKGKSRLNGAKNTYAHYGKETPLLLYDSTLSGSGKAGFLVTDQHVYLKDVSKVRVLSLSDALTDIHQGINPSNNCVYFYFGDYGVHLLQSGDMVKKNVADAFVEFFIALILFLRTIKLPEMDLWNALVRYQQLPQPKKNKAISHRATLPEPSVCFCFECGAENDVGDRFCCECGAELD